jgi:SAM-dependent methyltransferase
LFFNFTPFDWEHIYGNSELENIGWYLDGLDPDMEESLRKSNIVTGTFLDIGTGPGTQAVELAGRGFTVTATDISDIVIKKVRKLSKEVDFLVDDIVDSKLDKKFDYIFDRGCFHSINPPDRNTFVKQVCGLLKEDGIFFLKCFSDKERWFSGPYRFSAANIETIFGEYFKILEIKDTQFYGQSTKPLASLFVVLKHK